ncbi:MAG: periplasmic heavy metal sensor [Myxococcales bacterium]|nr:periplasmic heavy metal sensor [Myxococcales bacterium]
MTRSLAWKLLLALSLGANAALGAFLVLRSGAAESAEPTLVVDELPCLLERIGLDPAQQDAVDRARAGFETAYEARRAALRRVRAELFGLIERSPGDRAALEECLTRLGAAQLDLRRELVDQILAIAAVLRPEQRERFLDGLRDRFVEGLRHRETPRACPGAATGGAEGRTP